MTILPGLEVRLGESVARAIPAPAGGARVSIDDVRTRPRTTLIRATVGDGPGAVRLMIKVPRLAERRPTARPRIVPDTPPVEKAILEAATLRAIEASIALDPDPRLGAVSVIDVYEDIGAIVMTTAPGVPVGRLVIGSVGRGIDRTAYRRLLLALESAGAWLHRFQRLAIAADRPIRIATRADVVALATAIGDHLAPLTSSPAAVPGIVAGLVRAADATLPEALPVALHHGDFAARNLLLQGERTVTAIDALGRWRMPAVDDLARLLVDLETSRVQTATLGLALSARQRGAFADALFAGYGSGDVDRAAVRTYAVLLTLDRWAARVDARTTRGRRLTRLSDRIVDAHFARVARRLLAPENDRRSGGF